MEVKFLFAWHGHAVFGSRGKEPLPYLGDHGLINGWVQALEQSELRDFAMLVDNRVEDDIAFGAVGEPLSAVLPVPASALGGSGGAGLSTAF